MLVPLLLQTMMTPANAGFYDCTSSVECSSTYGPPTVGTESDMEAACDADSSCVAYQYVFRPEHSHFHSDYAPEYLTPLFPC